MDLATESFPQQVVMRQKKKGSCGGCGLDMPLRTSSLSSDNLDATPTPLTNNNAKSLSSKHSTPPSSTVLNSNSVAGVLMRHERRGSLNCPSSSTTAQHHKSSVGGVLSNGMAGKMRAPRPATVSYELSDDIRQKEIELMERRYGGPILSHRAARCIQKAYRHYQMCREYQRIRNNRVSRRMDSQFQKGMMTQTSITNNKKLNGEIQRIPEHVSRPALARQASVEDLVLDQAYHDWQQNELSSSSGNQTPQRSSTSSSIRHNTDSSSGLPSPHSHHLSPNSTASPTSVTFSKRDSGVADDSQSSGPSASNSTSSMNSSNSEGIVMASRVPSTSLSTSVECPSTCGTLTPSSTSEGSACVTNSTPTKMSPSHHLHKHHLIPSPARVTESLSHQDSPQPPLQYIQQQGNYSRTRCPPVHTSQPSCCMPHPGSDMGGFCTITNEKKKKRLYRICLNYFNKSPLKGLDMLIRNNFISGSPVEIAKSLLTRKGISRWAIGEYLGSVSNELAKSVTKHFIELIDLRDKEVDVALRHLLSYFRIPGESQKISHIIEVFNEVYVEQNPIRTAAQFRKTDTIMLVGYAVLMLHTDLYNVNVRDRMTRNEFVNNLRGIDDGQDIDRNLLFSFYDRTREQELKPDPDHTEQVRRIEQHLTGELRPQKLVEPHRRLVCFCKVFEVPDITKKDRAGSHQRDVFLFNDLLIVTKSKNTQKRRKEGSPSMYQCRLIINLLKAEVYLFQSQHYSHGIQIKKDSKTLLTLNTKSSTDRDRFVEDLQESIQEVNEMDRYRIEEERLKQHRNANMSNVTPATPPCTTSNSKEAFDPSAHGDSVSALSHHKHSHLCTSSSSLPTTHHPVHPLSRSSSRTSSSSGPTSHNVPISPPPSSSSAATPVSIVPVAQHQKLHYIVGQCSNCPQMHRHHPQPYQHQCYNHHVRNQVQPSGVCYTYHHGHHTTSHSHHRPQQQPNYQYKQGHRHHKDTPMPTCDSGVIVDIDPKLL